MSNLMKIHAYIQRLQKSYPIGNVSIVFKLYVDWSGAFGYNDYASGKSSFITIKAFSNFEELEKIINEISPTP